MQLRFWNRAPLMIALCLFVLTAPEMANAQAVDLPDGVVGWWPLDDLRTPINGPAYTIDLASLEDADAGPDPLLVPPVEVSGKVDGAFDFSGTLTLLSVADRPELDLDPSVGFTIMAWVKPDDVTYEPIVSKGPGYEFSITSGTLFLSMCDMSLCIPYEGTDAVPTGTWTLVAVSYAPGTATFFVNNSVETVSGAGPGTLLTAGANFEIGHSPGTYYDGAMDEVMLFDRALSQSEVLDIYDAGGDGVDKSDCNGNDRQDGIDVALGSSADCNSNDVPDECELAGNDCNGNGILDTCEIAYNDCNNNGIPDDCELPDLAIRVSQPYRDYTVTPASPPPATTLAFYSFDVSGSCATQGWTSTDVCGMRGDFAGLAKSGSFVQEDPCAPSASCVWSFTSGSTANMSCAGFPFTPAVPYGDALGYIRNEIRSPKIPLTAFGTQLELHFDVYEDNPLDPLVFYTWRVRSWVAGSPTEWRSRETLFYGPYKRWIPVTAQIGDLIEPGASDIQVALGVRDMDGVWNGLLGTGACHRAAPLFDNVEVVRKGTSGPAWDVEPVDLFQDNFASDGTTTGTVRIDAARDEAPPWDPMIQPADECAVHVADFVDGLKLNGGKDDVRIYVLVDSPTTPKSGSGLTDQPGRFPHLGTWVDANSNTWDMFQLDQAYDDSAQPIQGKYVFDFDDGLFVPGDVVYYFFGAQNGASQFSYWTEPLGVTTAQQEAADNATEVTCLPRANLIPGDRILYIDDTDGWGAQPYFDTTFGLLGLTADDVDRYDTRAPSTSFGTSIGGRVVNATAQLGVYDQIIWNTGDLTNDMLERRKGDDFAALTTFVDQHDGDGGLFMSGNDLATWIKSDPRAAGLLSLIPFNVSGYSHYNYSWGTSPLVVSGSATLIDFTIYAPFYILADASCMPTNLVTGFDVLEPLGSSTTEMTYGGSTNPQHSAVVANSIVNGQGSTMNLVLGGFSYHHIIDLPGFEAHLGPEDSASNVPARAALLEVVLDFLGVSTTATSSGDDTPAAYSLSQNYPNPFNPSTTIRFVNKERGPVRLAVYNARGQLVRVLVDERRSKAGVRSVEWDGRNDTGARVASGIYFYRLKAGPFAATKKMVLIK